MPVLEQRRLGRIGKDEPELRGQCGKHRVERGKPNLLDRRGTGAQHHRHTTSKNRNKRTDFELSKINCWLD